MSDYIVNPKSVCNLKSHPISKFKRKQHTETHRDIYKHTNKTKTKAQYYVKQPVLLWKSTIFCSVFHFFSPIVLNLRCGYDTYFKKYQSSWLTIYLSDGLSLRINIPICAFDPEVKPKAIIQKSWHG